MLLEDIWLLVKDVARQYEIILETPVYGLSFPDDKKKAPSPPAG
jgi:hypothetical protein